MSEATSTASQAKSKTVQSPMILSVLPVLILFVGAAVLFSLTTRDLAGTVQYWEIFLPAVAVMSVFSGWNQAQMMGESRLWYLIRQLVHWGAIIAVLYLFNAVGFREMLSDQQYTVILLGLLSLATLLAAVQMDYKLLVFGFFLAYCAYILFLPADNPALDWAGNLFHVADPEAHPATIVSVMAVVGFVASLIIHYFIPWRQVYEDAPAPTTGGTTAD